MAKESPKRLTGRTCWKTPQTSADVSAVRNALLSDDQVAFDTTWAGREYTVTLAPTLTDPQLWRGSWKCKDGKQGQAGARKYDLPDGRVVFDGFWDEDGRYEWSIGFYP